MRCLLFALALAAHAADASSQRCGDDESQPKRILVTSATGRVGREVIARIRQREKARGNGNPKGPNFIRAGTRNLMNGLNLKAIGADEVIAFDFANPATFAPALEGVNVVYNSSPDPLDGTMTLVEQHKTFVRAMDPRVVKHVVRLGCIGTRLEHAFELPELAPGTGCDNRTLTEQCLVVPAEIHARNNPYAVHSVTSVPHVMRAYASAEKLILERGIPLTSIRGGFFMGHFFKSTHQHMLEKGAFPSVFGRVSKPDVSSNDLGDICAKVILDGPADGEGGHRNEFYEVTGASNESIEEILAHIANAIDGREIRFEDTSSTVTEVMKDRIGRARWDFVSYLLEHKEISERVSPDFKRVMGREPEGYEEYLSVAGAAGQTGLQEIFGSKFTAQGVLTE